MVLSTQSGEKEEEEKKEEKKAEEKKVQKKKKKPPNKNHKNQRWTGGSDAHTHLLPSNIAPGDAREW